MTYMKIFGMIIFLLLMVTDQWDEIADKFDRVADSLNHLEKINELIYGGNRISQGKKILIRFMVHQLQIH